jgi:hypothetical protein
MDVKNPNRPLERIGYLSFRVLRRARAHLRHCDDEPSHSDPRMTDRFLKSQRSAFAP